MDKNTGVISEIKVFGGVPTLFINGKPFTSAAYMTYFEQFNEYKSFSEAGYDFFSAPVLFAGRWINSAADTPAFKKGIFDTKHTPDFTLLDDTVNRILDRAPEAYIFPRVNISLPEWWEKENPEDVNLKIDGTTCRESMYSEKWRKDVSAMLRQLVNHVNSSEYARHIAGYQIAGGNTEEWFHFDLNAGFCKNAEKGFKAFLEKFYPIIKFTGLPDISKLNKKTIYHHDEYLALFLEYASYAVADAITEFSSVIKQETDGNVIVGTFYGYSLEVTSPLYGTHALKILLKDRNIDFICSPCSYIGIRDKDSDWTEMFPADSVRLHGKMCFQECDIRTSLTSLLSEKDKSLDPERRYTSAIWKGPETIEQSVSNIRKTFCRQLVKGNGLWWFDMWGGWFADRNIMVEMKKIREIIFQSLTYYDRKSIAEIAVLVDEGAYKYFTDCRLRNCVYTQRKALGLTGVPYDVYDVYDFNSVKGKYKAFIFTLPVKTQYLADAVSFCKSRKIPYLIPSALKYEFSVGELRAFYEQHNVKIYCRSNDILYINNNYAALYAVTDGQKEIYLNGEKKIRNLLPGNSAETVSDTIRITMKKGETALFVTESKEYRL